MECPTLLLMHHTPFGYMMNSFSIDGFLLRLKSRVPYTMAFYIFVSRYKQP